MIGACLLLVAMVIPAANAQDTASEERLLKAVFIFNFAKFTRWPGGEGEGGALIFCTAGKDEVVDALEQLSGKVIKGHPVIIRPLAEPSLAGSCKLLYVARSERKRRRDIIESVRGKPVLTISEKPGFVDVGGIIELYSERDRIRFIINLAAARGAGLEFSSRLLNLAVVVNHEEAR